MNTPPRRCQHSLSPSHWCLACSLQVPRAGTDRPVTRCGGRKDGWKHAPGESRLGPCRPLKSGYLQSPGRAGSRGSSLDRGRLSGESRLLSCQPSPQPCSIQHSFPWLWPPIAARPALEHIRIQQCAVPCMALQIARLAAAAAWTSRLSQSRPRARGFMSAVCPLSPNMRPDLICAVVVMDLQDPTWMVLA